MLRDVGRFSQIGIIGHSQGSLIAMLAAKRVSVDAFVSVAGPSRTIDDVIRGQLATQLKALRDLKKWALGIIEELSAGRYVEDVPAEL